MSDVVRPRRWKHVPGHVERDGRGAAGRAESPGPGWATDRLYVDPMLEAEGHGALGEMVAAVQAKFPGHRFRRRSGVDTHHDQLRFAWDLVAPDGAVVVAGIDIGALAADGRLERITGFFGEVPAMAAA